MSTIDEAMAQALAAEESANGDWVKDERYSTKEYYSDTDVSIDIKQRAIGDVSENISTVGENNAQYISFVMDRYIDGVDLKDMLIQLQAEASEDIGVIDEPVNVYYNETHIRFGWSIPQDITQQATTIKIIVFCTGTLSDGNTYTIKTLPLSYEVKDTLVIGGFIPQPNENWYLQFVNAMDEKVTTATTAATTATQNAEKVEANILLAQESAEIATQKAAEADASAIEASEAASIASLKATEVSANASTAQESERNAKLSETNAKTSESNAAASLDDVKVIEANVIALASNASNSADVAIQKASDASIYANNANASVNAANAHATTSDAKAKEASSFAILAESYAHGSTNVRENENIDNAKYYYEQTKQITQGFNGIVNMGTISFEELPSVEIRTNAMYNINNSFISDERFKDGGGIFYGAGNNVVWTVEEKWDVLASSNVIGVKGAKETVYRQGNVEITPENIGALPADGNAISATKAEQDANGNVIAEVYAKQNDIPTKVSELENDSKYVTSEEAKKTVPMTRGGTGATTAREAQYNLLQDAIEITTDVTDETMFLGKYLEPVPSDGTVYKRTALTLWNYIKSKISSALGLTSTEYNGNAKSASRLSNDSSIGSATNPVYFNANGIPVKTTHTLETSVPSDAKFTDAMVTNTLNATAKAYITGTTNGATNTGTQVFDPAVFLGPGSGQLNLIATSSANYGSNPQVLKLAIPSSSTTLVGIKILPYTAANSNYLTGLDIECGTSQGPGMRAINVNCSKDTNTATVYIRRSGTNAYALQVPNGKSYISTLYSNSSTITVSDKEKKKDVKGISKEYEELFFKLQPRLFKFKDGTSGRVHIGAIAQEVEEALKEVGISDTDFAGFVRQEKDYVINEETGEVTQEEGYDYYLRYEEFIMLLCHMLQKLYSEKKKQDDKIVELEERLVVLENKMFQE